MKFTTNSINNNTSIFAQIGKDVTIQFEVASKDTRNGFKHEGRIWIDDYRQHIHGCASSKICYLNRTWESYRYQSLIHKLFKALKTKDNENRINQFIKSINHIITLFKEDTTMATSNFYSMNNLPGIYFCCIDDYFDDSYMNDSYRYLDQYEFDELQDDIDNFNRKIRDIYYQLSDSPRYKDRQEADNLYDLKVEIKAGYYEGYQLYLRDYDYEILNKTHQRMIKRFFYQMARKYHLPVYIVAYRFSNGETGYNLIKQY